jgi:IS30 family transposase
MNRMIRRYFPKGTDFRKISNDEIQHVEDLINNMKRKIFNGRSSKDMEKIELSNKL